MPTRVDIRVQYYDRPWVLTVNQSETVYMSLFAGETASAITHGSSTCTLRDRDGTLLATGTVADDGDGIKASITVPAATAIGSGYSLIWTLAAAGGSKIVRQAAVVAPYPLTCPLIHTDWLRLHPNDTAYPSGESNFGTQLEEAWTELLWRLPQHTRSFDADIWDTSRLRPILIAIWERIVFRLLSTNIGVGRHAAEADRAEEREKEEWQTLVLDYDVDGDGDRDVVDEKTTAPAFPPPLWGP